MLPNNAPIEMALASIEKRKTKLNELDVERERLLKEIDGLEVAIVAFRQDCCTALAPLENNYYTDPTIAITRRARDAVYEVLSAERPLHRSEVWKRVEAVGVHIIGEDPVHILGSYISPDKRLVPVPERRGYWTLADEPTSDIHEKADSEPASSLMLIQQSEDVRYDDESDSRRN